MARQHAGDVLFRARLTGTQVIRRWAPPNGDVKGGYVESVQPFERVFGPYPKVSTARQVASAAARGVRDREVTIERAVLTWEEVQ